MANAASSHSLDRDPCGRRSEMLMDEAPVGTYLVDAELHLVYLNAAALAAFGETPPLIGRDLHEVLCIAWGPGLAQEFVDIFRHALKTGEGRQVPEMSATRADRGMVEWYEWRVERVRLPGEGFGLVCYFMDITQRKLDEAELKVQLELTRTITDNSTQAIFMMDERGQCTFMNPAAEKMLGYTPDEITSRPLHDIIHHHHPDGRPYPKQECPIDRALPENFDIREHEDTFIRKNGQFFPVLVAASPIFKDGRPVSTVIEVRDVTERKRLDQSLRDLNSNLEQQVAQRTAEAESKTRQVRRMHIELVSAEERERKQLAQVLHDGMQQLLVAAKMRVQMLIDHPSDATPTQLRQIDDLLGESVNTSRSLTAELAPPVLYDRGLVAGLRWLAQDMEHKYGLCITVDAAPDCEPTRESVRILLFRCAREALFNVLKHAGTKTTRVTVKRTDGTAVELSVCDEGRGFDRAPGHAGTATSYGLASLAERAAGMGGQLNITTSRDAGTRVCIRIPMDLAIAPGGPKAVADPTAFEPPMIEKDQRQGPSIRVVLADDHKIVREGITALLASCQSIRIVAEAENGEQAIELARRLRPHVIIMDINMPKLNGIEATRVIAHELPEIRVVGLSMHDSKEVFEAMLAAGAVTCLPKDGPSSDLFAAISRCSDAAV